MAADGLLRRPVYEACIAGGDSEIHRRPYHRNCGCALHKSRRQQPCSHSNSQSKSITYPIRRSWSEGSLTLTRILASASSSSVVGKSSLPPPDDVDDDDEDEDNAPIRIARN